MAKFKVVLESGTKQTEYTDEFDSLEQATFTYELVTAITNEMCEDRGIPTGRIVSIEEVSNGNEN